MSTLTNRVKFWSDRHHKKMPGIVAHICNLNTQDAEAKGSESKDNLGYIMSACLKNKPK